MEIRKAYSYNDVLLVPSYSELGGRGEVNLRSTVASIGLDVPLLSAPMDTVTEENMATFMWEKGGLGVIHRYCDINKQYSMVKWVREMRTQVAAAIGINGDTKERVDALVEAGANILVMDIAHGHSAKALKTLEDIKNNHRVEVMSPNIVTRDAALDYISSGADALRVGVGPGSACTTRTVAGVGVPQITAIMDVRSAVSYARSKASVVADGGIKKSGDVVKALAAGADAVMLGGMLAPFVVAAGPTKSVEDPTQERGILFGTPKYTVYKYFRGMASEDALKNRKDRYVVEGESFLIPVRYDHDEYLNKFIDGIKQGFSYLGAKSLVELRENAEFVEVSPQGYLEGTPHFKGVKE